MVIKDRLALEDRWQNLLPNNAVQRPVPRVMALAEQRKDHATRPRLRIEASTAPLVPRVIAGLMWSPSGCSIMLSGGMADWRLSARSKRSRRSRSAAQFASSGAFGESTDRVGGGSARGSPRFDFPMEILRGPRYIGTRRTASVEWS